MYILVVTTYVYIYILAFCQPDTIVLLQHASYFLHAVVQTATNKPQLSILRPDVEQGNK